ncbi:hypothetical protein BGZ73_000572 [Actinomortierella ambigua]|nr:hypothetical protein BGZ73_000572 [Actinomortierella ambigua]
MASPRNVVAKSTSSFLVCSGAPGVGKTRFGHELYDALQRRLPKAAKQQGLEFSPQFYHLFRDFSQDISLQLDDAELKSGIILGLRMAYSHFVGHKYQGSFDEFFRLASPHKDLFNLNSVIRAIRHDLQLSDNQRQLFIFLHIDEFQRIFEYGWNGIPANIHRDVSLSDAGTNPTESYNLQGLRLFPGYDAHAGEYLRCPPLSMGARYDIMSHFAGEANVPHHKWMPKREFFHLLAASGGLPRALQFVLEELFGSQLERYGTFGRTVSEIDKDVDRIFDKVATRLDTAYSITNFAGAHKELVHALVRLCILEKPSPRTLAPSNKFPALTLVALERDSHTILEDSPGDKVLVRIPHFFLHIYNTVIDEVRNYLGVAFVHNWEEGHEWKFFEHIIAEYEALRTKLLIEGGCNVATLGSIYKGAVGLPETSNITVKLKELSVVTAAHRFPRRGEALVVDGQDQDWRSDSVVVKNADGVSFADVFLYRQSTEGSDIICALQVKKVVRLSDNTLAVEHSKNKNAIKAVRNGSMLHKQEITKARVITVLITTAAVDSASHILDMTSFPKDCLLIHRGNFADYFDETFSTAAIFTATSDHNVNFMSREGLQKKHKLTDAVVDQVMENMPFRSYGDLVAKVPAMASRPQAEMGFFPYEEFGRSKKRLRVV